MFDLRSKSSHFVALALTAVTTLSALTFMPAEPAQAAVVSSGDGLCTATVDVGYLVTTYNSGDYCYIAFKNAGQTYNWTPQPGVSKADVLIVAGGGGGGSRHAGGGGAGGLVQLSGTTISGSQVMSIVVGLGGSGGPGGTSSYGAGTNGGNSAFASNTAIGGGAGTQGGNGNSGGSGGGGGNNATASSTFTSGQGNSGGIGNYSSPWSGGGGGGAGAAGTNSTSSVTGAGGNGLATSRAKAVATYLRKLGVNVAISYTGYGAYNKTSPSANDRRVEIRWIAKD